MRVIEVRARAFGPLGGARLVLGRGMSVIHGPNEAGKSSWHAAIFAALGGMRRGRGARRKDDQEFAEQYKPWSGETWAVEADVELDSGRRLQVLQDLADPASSRAIDIDTARDVAAELDLVHDGAPDLSRRLGLTRDILAETLSVRQADVLRVRAQAGELQEQLQRAAATGGRDETAQAAMARIGDFRAEHVGQRRKNSTKPLQVATTQVATARAAQARARQDHEAYLALVESRNAAGREAARCRAARVVLARRRLARAEELAARFPDGEPRAHAEIEARATALAAALEAFDARPRRPLPLEGKTAEALAAELSALPAMPEGDLAAPPDLLEAERLWREARGRVAALAAAEPVLHERPAAGPLDAARLRALADRLDAPVPAVDPDLERRAGQVPAASRSARVAPWLLPAGIAVTVLGALAAALGAGPLREVGFVGLAVGLVLVLLSSLAGARLVSRRDELGALRGELGFQRAAAAAARESADQARAQVEAAGLAVDPMGLREIARRLDDFDAARRNHEAWAQRLERAAREEAAAAEALYRALAARPGEEGHGNDPESMLRRYRARCAERSGQAAAAARRPELAQRLEDRRFAEQAASAQASQRAAAEERLRAAGLAESICVDSLDDAVPLLRERRARLVEECNRRVRQREEWAELQAILDGRDLGTMRDEVRDLGAAPSSDAAAPALDPGREGEAVLRDLERRHDAACSRFDTLQGVVAARERDLPDVVAADEVLARAESELSRLEALDRTLERTLAFLDEARDRVQRDIAPRLRRSIETRLPQVTGGRYHEALVDPATLEVHVRPRGGEWRPAARLSHGTAEQIYLLVRLALVEHMVTTGESAPLLLDDVTVQADAARTMALLELLHEVSRERQVILFSQEPEVLDWARARLTEPGDTLVELPPAERPLPHARPIGGR